MTASANRGGLNPVAIMLSLTLALTGIAAGTYVGTTDGPTWLGLISLAVASAGIVTVSVMLVRQLIRERTR